MSKNIQSIEDLIGSALPTSNNGDDTAQSKFAKKQSEIKAKELEGITEKSATNLGVSYINLKGFPISPEAISLLSEEESRNYLTICFFYDGSHIRLGSMDLDINGLEAMKKRLEEKYFCDIKTYLISENSLNYALELYKNMPKVREFVKGISITEEDLDKYSEKFSSFQDLQNQINISQISDVITLIMASSVKAGASDVHVEAEEHIIKIRFRVDGILIDVATLNREMWSKIISRLKVLANVKININDKPQDGRISIFTKKERIDIRVSFLPTNYGESVVMRLLRSSSVGLTFEDLGIRGDSFEQLKREVERPNGMIVTTGPTGSGKTTTLYALLKKLNKPENKIITIEDPIEYQLEGVNQSQTSEKYTFAQGLRSVVRQDPDVIMVGEIRDLETAEVAIQAALTGHMVLSTIHTNDAAGAIPRFLSMGTKPFLLAPALNAVIGQRLVRRICVHCKQEVVLSDEETAKVKRVISNMPDKYKNNIIFEDLKFYHGVGCEKCQSLGYKGRVGIYEIFTMTQEIEKVILSGSVSEYDIRDLAKKNGMITMAQDGVLKAIEGLTSLEEVFRVADVV